VKLFDNIPQALRSLPQWVNFKTEMRDGKETKIPLNPRTLLNAKSNDPSTWTSYEEAVKNCRNGIGLGFVFTKSDPFTGVDLDKCIDPVTGEIERWALRIINTIGSYTEKSPSGTGIHIITESKLPVASRKVGRIECYDSGRFFTFTGDILHEE
jgi:putative DNA primase/helicase